jgi:hypothetical protein
MITFAKELETNLFPYYNDGNPALSSDGSQPAFRQAT